MRQSPHIFGIHDEAAPLFDIIGGANRTGWCVTTHEVTRENGKDFLSMPPHISPIARLNYSHQGAGTIPYSNEYAAFAQQCAAFVRNSRGCNVWIIGNEMNYPVEAPKYNGTQELITPANYARCYSLCRDAILGIPGHENDHVLVGAVAPWNNKTPYPGNESGDWIQYFSDVLTSLSSCSGIAIHAYSHGSSPDLIHDSSKMNPPFQAYHYNFPVYRDFMNAIPASLRHVPVYITESNQGDIPWRDTNSGWVQRAYGEINWWNQQPGNQQIRALCLYRWNNHDRWCISDKNGVIDDFKQALSDDYRWQEQAQVYTPWTGYVTAPNGLNVRTQPNTQGFVVRALPYGATVTVIGEQAGWYVVDGGYMAAQYISKDKPQPIEPTTPPVTTSLVDTLAQQHGLDPKFVRAVIKIESGGQGFINGRLIVRFEPHIFFGYLSLADKQRAWAMFTVGNPQWDGSQHKALLGDSWTTFHGNQDREYQALALAVGIHQEAAYKSISIGAPQIMGFHHALLDYPTAEAMFTDFATSEDVQIKAMFTFMDKKGAIECLRRGDLLAFATIYNGSGQAAHYRDLITQAANPC